LEVVTITDIRKTKKGNNALFCDAGFLFSIDDVALINNQIEIGSKLDLAAIEDLKRAGDHNKAYVKALDYLAMRDHSEKELYNKLIKRFDEMTAQSAVERMRGLDYLDDGEFAKKYASELTRKKHASRREVQNKLMQKGISREIIDEVLPDSGEDETAQIRDLIQKKYTAKLETEDGRKSLFGTLMRKGFTARDIREVFREFDAEIFEE